ncbi:hypothetical protein AJ79_08385 [Helicocarpus griseus UAMH5409]|uniref:Uncharacterized protein n=1 Tax=Helicocarpus griseus UAMH5409 TaxID=1447875 RepID=A0A2B7WKK5_9EURO|nr:hypothetical protein AJ79_08385 [Helicocarpus griseus UAMH5409]
MEDSKYDEEDIDQMWREALVEFHKLSGYDPKKFTGELSVGDVIGKIGQQKEKDEKKAAKYSKAKRVLDKTLTCIQTLGNIAAQGASMVFGPSALCFNAVSFLITTARSYSKIFAGIAELFERISAFLERFEVYVRSKSLGVEIDIHLRKIIHELLRSFMRICALSIKVSRENKFLLALEVFSFGSDKGVQAELDNLETLVQRETGMSVALILESAKITEGKVTAGFAETRGSLQNLDGKVDGVTGQLSSVSNILQRRENADRAKESDSISKKNREKIKQALKIEKEAWRNDQEEFMRTRVPSTGQWLLEDPQFTAWVDGKDEVGPILALEAKQGFGKSYLCSAAIRHLSHLPGNHVSRMSVAYYFFQNDNKDEQAVNKALRATVWQLTHNDVVYQKSAAAACDKPEEFGNSLELWKQLVFYFSARTEGTFFIILDGVDEAETETGHPLLKILRDITLIAREKRPMAIRVLLTGRPRAFVQIKHDPDISMSSIDLGSKNKDDIVKYIDARMDNMEILRRSDQPDIKELRSRILAGLTDGAGGDFFKLNYMLTDISKKRRRKEIEEVLEHAGEDRLDTIAREVERLNSTLGEEDIQDLNDLLSFIIISKIPSFIELLEAILYVKNGDGSLVPLEEQIRDKYAAFLEVGPNQIVSLTSDSIIDYFRRESSREQDVTTGGSSSVLHEAEVAIIRRFLRNVCDEELFNKFGFEEFFKRKLGNKTASIHVDLDRAKVDILTTCLKAIFNERDGKTTALANYTLGLLADHLDDVDLALTPPGPKGYIGSLLIKLFREKEYIEFWYLDPKRSGTWHSWVEDDKNVNITMKWFKDSAVVKGLSEDERQWVNGLTSNSKPDDDLLRPTAKVLAENWLRRPNWDVKCQVLWLANYVFKMKSRIDGSARRTVTDFWTLTEEDLLEVENWAQSELNVSEKDHLWAVQIAHTHGGFFLRKKFLELSIAACEQDSESWRAQYCLARAYGDNFDYTKALEVLARVAEKFRANTKLMEEEGDFFYSEVLHLQGTWYREIEDYDASVAAFMEISAQQTNNYWNLRFITDVLYKQGKYADIISHLHGLKSQTDSDELNRLFMAFEYQATNSTHNQMVIDAGRRSGQLKVVKEMYQSTIRKLTSGYMSPISLSSLRHWYSFALCRFPESESDREEAINILEDDTRQNLTTDKEALIDVGTVCYLASIYFEQAREAGFDGPNAENSLKKLQHLYGLGSHHDYLNTTLAITLARCYLLMGKEEQARETLKREVKTGLDLLSDEDPDNDFQGYQKLATTFHHINDDVNSLAAWWLLGPSMDESEERNQTEESQNQKDVVGKQTPDAEDEVESQDEDGRPGKEAERITSARELEDDEKSDIAGLQLPNEKSDISETEDENASIASQDLEPLPAVTVIDDQKVSIFCKGDFDCNLAWFHAFDVYVCKDCADVYMCRDCIEKHRAGTISCSLHDGICNSSHEFLYVPMHDWDEIRRAPKGHVKANGKFMPIADWLNNIRAEWGFAVAGVGEVSKGESLKVEE